MIWTALLAARSFLAKIPWQVWLVLAVLIAAWFWGNHQLERGKALTEAKYAAARAQAVAKARKADGVAVDTAAAGKASIEEGNDRAQEAASNSDDPLRAGLDSLR
jgi:hypothetical protein